MAKTSQRFRISVVRAALVAVVGIALWIRMGPPTLRAGESAPSPAGSDRALPRISPDIADVPALDVRIDDDEMKRYFLIGNAGAATSLPQGRRLLVVLPGGNGSAAFSPFIRRIYKNVLNDHWLVAEMVAPLWDRKQQVVWPTAARPYPPARFTTEELFDGVVEDVQARGPVDRDRVYILAWSSGGPAAYAIALREEPVVTGAFIAMSVFSAREAARVADRIGPSFYLLQSPDDRVTPFRHAQRACDRLSSAGARVTLARYSGGHGWRGNVYKLLSDGIEWLAESPVQNTPNPPDHAD
jgi:predicted esterase